MGEIKIDSVTHEETGTRRLDLWTEPAEGGAYGDLARGTAWTARYLSDAEDKGKCAEIAVYPVEDADGRFGVDMQSTIGGALFEDDSWRADDSADIDYEGLSYVSYETLEEAQAFADDRGKGDLSWALHLRPQPKPADVIEGVKDAYEDRIKAILVKIRDVVRGAGMSAEDAPYLLDGDEYKWYLSVWRTPDKGEIEDCIDISVEINEAAVYGDDDQPFGINFSIDIVEWGGRIVGGISPYNYTSEVWVDARDEEAVATRFEIIEDADISEIPTLIKGVAT